MKINDKVAQILARNLIKSDLAVRKLLGLKKPESEFYVDKKGIVRKK